MKITKFMFLWLWCFCAAGATVSYQTTNRMILQPPDFFQLHVLPGPGIQVTYNPPTNTVTISATGNNNVVSVNGSTRVTNANFESQASGIYFQTSLGTNIEAFVSDGSITFNKMQTVNPESILGYGAGVGANVIRRVTLGANLYWSGDTINATSASGSNSWQIAVDGSLVTEPNLVDASRISVAASGTNITFDVVASSLDQSHLATNGVISGTYSNATVTVNSKGLVTGVSSGAGGGGDGVGSGTNAFVNGLLYQPFRLTNNFTDTGRVIWRTNSDGDILAYATNLPSGGGSGAGTNAFVNGVLQQPFRLTNSADTAWSDDGSGNWRVIINTNRFYSLLTNSLIASNNVSIAYDGGALKVMISAAASGGTGTAVTVDGGSDLVRLNLADSSSAFLFDLTGTNVAGRLPDRDFGDLTTSSSGTVMTIDNSAVTSAKINDSAVTSNKLAAANVTIDKLSATGTPNSTNFLAGDYFWKQVTTNMIPGLVTDIAALQRTLTFTNGVTNVNNVVSADIAAGSNITLSTNNGKITITAASGGGSVLVNGSTVSNPNFTNSSTVLFSVANGTNVTATVTNVAGATTQNVAQRIGSGIFRTTLNNIADSSYSGVVTNITHNAGDGSTMMEVQFTLSGVTSTNYFVSAEIFDTNSPDVPAVYDIIEKTTSGFKLASSVFNGTAQPNGYWYRVWVLDTVSVAGSGGDVISTNNNTFTATNTFSGPIVFGGTSRTNWPSGTKTITSFRPTDAQPPAANFATLDTRNSVAVLEFDGGSTDESTVFVGVIPEAAVLTGGLMVRIIWAADTATSGAVRWGVQFERMTTDLDSDSFDTATEANSTTSGTSGVPNILEITATSIDSLTAGDGYRIKIYREASDTGNDTMAGDAQLVVVELRTVN